MFGLDLHTWEEIMIWSLGIAAIAALGVLVSTGVVIRLQRDALKESTVAFEKYKVDAGIEIAEATRGAAKANERAATLEREAAEARLETERIKERLAWRRVTAEQKKALIAALKPFAGQRVTISSAMGNAEARTYADDFVKVLDAAGWDHNGAKGIFVETVWKDVILGIQITVHPGPDPTGGMVTPGVLALIKTMRKLGLTEGPHEFYTDPAIPVGMADLRVGVK